MFRPFNAQACGEYEYFITFTNDYSRYSYVYLMHRKFDALDQSKEFKVELKNQMDKHLEILWFDRGEEHILGKFDSFLKENGIISQLSVLRTS